MAREVILVDLHAGYPASVQRALIHVGASVAIVNEPERISAARMIVLHGQSTPLKGKTLKTPSKDILGEALQIVISRGDPVLGIDAGMHALIKPPAQKTKPSSGFGVFAGKLRAFQSEKKRSEHQVHRVKPFKVPHVGWNDVQPIGDHYYFDHINYVDAANPEDVMWSVRYGNIEFPAVLRQGNIYGCQFRPEKSQWAGLRFLRSFILGGRS